MVHMMHVHFVFFAVFKNSKSSFSEDTMPEHALNIYIEGCPIKREIWGSNFKVAQQFSIFLYNSMETTGVRQEMGIMHSGVMYTDFHSGDAWDSMP